VNELATEIKDFCHDQRIWLDKDMGQHYLLNQNVLDQIVSRAHISPDETVVEIGAGIGVLTRDLLKKTKHVIAIEVDKTIIPRLHMFLTLYGDGIKMPTVIHGDALKTQFPSVPYKIVANVPYHITSPLLRHAFFESSVAPTSLTLLIQREVAEKICDPKNASVLSIMVRMFGEPSMVCHVPPKDFLPPPKVDSSVIHIECFKTLPYSKQKIEEVMKLVKHAFSQKRKMIRNTLGSLPNGSELLAKANIAPTRRPQTIILDEWLKMAEYSSIET
jgi:16S rRNA (adenine1518-N6/adenine1519-N6)-dimethyltransferase